MLFGDWYIENLFCLKLYSTYRYNSPCLGWLNYHRVRSGRINPRLYWCKTGTTFQDQVKTKKIKKIKVKECPYLIWVAQNFFPEISTLLLQNNYAPAPGYWSISDPQNPLLISRLLWVFSFKWDQTHDQLNKRGGGHE